MREARLGDVVATMKNGLYKPASEYAEDGTPCLRMYNIDAGLIVWRDIKRMRVSQSELEEYGLREGDLLVNRVNSRELVGKAAYIPPSLEPSVFESKNIRVRIDKAKALPKFINYQLLARGRRHFAGNAQQVVGMASISQKQLADFPIVLTDLDKQRRIVAEIEKQFSRLDEAVANLRRVKANLKRYKAAVLKAAVEGRLVSSEAKRETREDGIYETGPQLLQRILNARRDQVEGRRKYREPKSSDAIDERNLPREWSSATIDQVAFVDVGFAFKSADFSSDGVKLLRGENIEPGRLRWNDTRYWPLHQLEPHRRLFVEAGEIILAMDRPIVSSGLKLARARQSDLPCLLVQRVARLRCVDRSVEGYLHIAMSTDSFHRHLVDGQTGTQLPHVSGSSISAFAFPLPPIDEQHRIVAEVDRRLSLADQLEAEVDANLKRALALRDALLTSTFTTSTQRLPLFA